MLCYSHVERRNVGVDLKAPFVVIESWAFFFCLNLSFLRYIWRRNGAEDNHAQQRAQDASAGFRGLARWSRGHPQCYLGGSETGLPPLRLCRYFFFTIIFSSFYNVNNVWCTFPGWGFTHGDDALFSCSNANCRPMSLLVAEMTHILKMMPLYYILCSWLQEWEGSRSCSCRGHEDGPS